MVLNSCKDSPFLTSPVSSVGEYSLMDLNNSNNIFLPFPLCGDAIISRFKNCYFWPLCRTHFSSVTTDNS